jgi:hypothetical protein
VYLRAVPTPRVVGVSSFVVESYLSAGASDGLGQLAARVEAAAAELTRDGVTVRYLHSSFIPTDELCLLFFEAPSPEVIAALLERADIRADRVTETVEMAHPRPLELTPGEEAAR